MENIGITVFRLFKTLPNSIFALQGNPILSVSPVIDLVRYAKIENIELKVTSSISSIDIFMSDTGIDISDIGMQVISARLIDKVSHLLPVLILNPGYSEMILAKDKFKILKKLSNKLLDIYGDEEFILYSSKVKQSEITYVGVDKIPNFLEEKSLGKYMIVGPIKYMLEYL